MPYHEESDSQAIWAAVIRAREQRKAPAVPTPTLAPEPPAPVKEDDGSSFVSGLLAPFMKAFDIVSQPAQVTTGLSVAEWQAEKEVLEAKGLSPYAAKVIAGLSLPGFAAAVSGGVRERAAEILSLEEKASISNVWRNALAFERERPAMFKGEKFISELVMDPLNLLLFLKPLSILGAGGRAATRAASAIRGAPKPKPLGKLAQLLVPRVTKEGRSLIGNLPTNQALRREGYTMNKLRRLTHTVAKVKFGSIPLGKGLVHILNPSGLLDASKAGDEAALATIDYLRLVEIGDNVVTTDMAPLRATAARTFNNLIHEKNDVFMRVTERTPEAQLDQLNRRLAQLEILRKSAPLDDVVQLERLAIRTANIEAEAAQVAARLRPPPVTPAAPAAPAAQFVDLTTEVDAFTTRLTGAAPGALPTLPPGASFREITSRYAAPEAAKLPDWLAKATPNYNIGQTRYMPQFESDIDKAFFIVAQARRSRQDEAYMAWLREQFPKLSDTELRTAGGRVREHIKAIVRVEPEGDVIIPLSSTVRELAVTPAAAAAPAARAAATVGRSITDKFAEGINAGSIFEGGAVSPGLGYSWRSMGPAEYKKIIEGQSFGGPAQKGGFWSWFPRYSANLTGTSKSTKYLVEVEIASKGEALTRSGTIQDVRAVWKSEKKGSWIPEAFSREAPTTAAAAAPAARAVSGLPRPNIRLATKELARLKGRGIDTSNADIALGEYRSLKRADFTDADDFKEARLEAWDDFIESVNAIDATEVLVPLPRIAAEVGEVVSEVPPPLVTPAARAAAEVGEVVREVPLGDIFQHRSRYVLNEDELAVMEKADEIIDAFFDLAKREGVDISELVGGRAGEHYFPRFVTALREIENLRSPTGGRMVGAKAGFVMRRIHDFQEAGLQNGVNYLGTGAKNPIADVVEVYARAMNKMVADKRFADMIKPLGKTITDQIGIAVTAQVNNTRRVWGAAVRASGLLAKAFVGYRPGGGDLAGLRRFNPELAQRFEVAYRLSDEVERSRAILVIQRSASNIVDLTKAQMDDAIAAKNLVLERAKRPLGKVTIQHPAFAGRVFNREVMETVMNAISPMRGPMDRVLATASDISSLMRLGSLTLDWGFGMLQGAMVLTRAPVAWAKAAGRSLHALADPEVRFRWMAQADVQEVLHTFGNRLHLGSPELLAAIRPGTAGEAGGAATRWLPKLPGGRFAVDQVFGRFGTSFEVFFDVARVEMAKAFVPAVKAGRVSADEVATYLNKMSGVMSSRALGISPTQRELEAAALFLAPRWTRATVALAADALQGGFRGSQARRSLAQFFGGTVLGYTGLAAALGQPIKLDPRPTNWVDGQNLGGDGAQFMTIEIAGHHVGLGGKPYSMIRTLVKMAADPENAMDELSRWYRGSAAPLTGSAWDLLAGENWGGDQLKTPDGSWDLAAVAREEGGKFLPFWIQSMIDDPPTGATGVASEFLGFRQWPQSPSELRNDLRDNLAAIFPLERLGQDQRNEMKRQGLDAPEWYMLSGPQRRLIETGKTGVSEIDDQNATLQRWVDKARERTRKIGDPDLTRYFDEIEDNRTAWEEDAKIRQKAVDDGVDSPKKFLKKMQDINSNFAYSSKSTHDVKGSNKEAITAIKARNDKKLDKKKFVPVVDQAKTDYMEKLIGNPKLTDEYDEFNFQLRNKIERGLRIDWGDDVINEVEEYFLTSKDIPPLWRRWVRDREIIVEYWRVKDSYMLRTPRARAVEPALRRAINTRNEPQIERLSRHPSILEMDREVRKRRDAVRERNPRLDAILFFWGIVGTTRTTRARRMAARMRL